jgi:hypothetical protein
MIKYSMTNQDAYDHVNEYVKSYTNNKSFSSSGQRLAYERGILTAILIYLLQDDFHVRNLILDRIESSKQKK